MKEKEKGGNKTKEGKSPELAVIFRRIKEKKKMQDIRKIENRKEKDKIEQKERIHKTEERKEEITEKVSFLTAFFEGKDKSSTPQNLNTPSRRSKKNRQRKIIDLKNQMIMMIMKENLLQPRGNGKKMKILQ